MLQGLLEYPGRSSGYLAEYLVVQVWAPPCRFINLMETVDFNHISQPTSPLRGWTVFPAFRAYNPAVAGDIMQYKNGDLSLGQVIGNIKWVLRIEGLAIFMLALIFYKTLGFSWITFFIYFIFPDLSFIGYAFGKKAGAITYNCAHSYIVPAILFSLSLIFGMDLFHIMGLIWTAHIGFDRALGYGLKYEKGFGYTHLGLIGKERMHNNQTDGF